MREKNSNQKLPLGLAMALAQNPGAMERFAAMDDAAKADLVARAKNISSKSEMQRLVQSLGDSGSQSFF